MTKQEILKNIELTNERIEKAFTKWIADSYKKELKRLNEMLSELKTENMTTLNDIINELTNNEKASFIISSEWLVERNGNRVGVNHTYHFKGESFDTVKAAEKYLKKKVAYLIKRGYVLTIDNY